MMDLKQLLEHITVADPAMLEGDHPSGMYAVDHGDHGIIAYFAFESDAFAFRLHLINLLLNPLSDEYKKKEAD